MAKPALGRGLGALLGVPPPAQKTDASSPAAAGTQTAPAEDRREKVHRIPLKLVRPCPLQPRKHFPDEPLKELAESIKEQGIIQPLILRPRGDNYELIAGERRWRAAQLLGLDEVPALIRDADDRSVLELALIENLQRENLDPIEEAQGFSQLIEQFGLTQEEAATKVGKSRAAVANSLRLLKLAPEVRDYIQKGFLSVGHAKVILGLSNPADQTQAATRVIAQSLNVRQTEELVARLQAQPTPNQPANAPRPAAEKKPRDLHVADLENRLKEKFGTKVALHYRRGKGSIEIQFFNDEDLERLLELLGVSTD